MQEPIDSALLPLLINLLKQLLKAAERQFKEENLLLFKLYNCVAQLIDIAGT